ncbi:DUF6215 domain-containing protein [Streptomyces sp. NPDC126499]|uniref:DUF6215 domain-containing protein n=1 Tax=Streptomyces sp. NPDC126499 TaxID=3155314 RepID=UPI00331F18FF
MAGDVGGSVKGPRVGAQVAAALALGGVLAGSFWFLAKTSQEGSGDRGPAVCTTAARDSVPPRYVSGTRLCEALNRPDLPALLGTPGEEATNAYGTHGWTTLGGSGSGSGSGSRTGTGSGSGTGSGRIPTPSGAVDLPTYSVKLSVSYDRLPVARLGRLLGNTVEPTKVLGRTALFYSDRTLAFRAPLGGGKAETTTGGIARHLLVARDPKDGGGSYELVIWRQDQGVPVDDAALVRVAERVLPTVPGWVATG